MPETPHPDGTLAPGTPITDRLTVVRLLGVGGLGTVYEVEHRFTRHRRAAKVLHPHDRRDAELVERFLREASAAGRIGNEHIVETFDAGLLPDGSPFIVMELLVGLPLNEALRQRGTFSATDAVAIIGQVCEAIHAAHLAGIIHRDLKPENLFVTERNGRPFLKVLDFGISKFQSDPNELMSSTRSGIAMGTPRYMAPEQVRDSKNADARSDVYSLGAILHELLGGLPPFDSDSFADLTVKILTTAPPALPASVPPSLAAVVARLLSKDPAARYQTADALRLALLELGQSGSLEVRAPIPLTAGMERPSADDLQAVRGNGRGIAFAVIALLAVGGLAWALWPRSVSVAEPTPVAPVLVPPVTPEPAATPDASSEVAVAPAEEQPTAAAATTVVVEPLPEPTSRPDKTPHKPHLPTLKGTADFACSPTACTVSVDGHLLGETPLLKQPLAVGTHTASFVNAETKATTRRTFEVKAGAVVKVPVTW